MFIIILGALIVSFWVYKKYFEPVEPNILNFTVEVGNINEVVRARGEVTAQKEFDLEFPFSGTIKNVFVKEGEEVKSGKALLKLDAKDFNLELQALESKFNQSQFNLEKLVKGATKEEIQLAKTKVANAEQTLSDTEKNLINTTKKADIDINNLYNDINDILNDAYTKADDAVNKQTTSLFSESNPNDFKLTFNTSNQSLKSSVELERLSIKNELDALKSEINNLSESTNLDDILVLTKNRLNKMRDFLLNLNNAVDDSVGITSSLENTYKGYVNTGRTNINTAISNINSQIQLISSQKATNESNIFTAKSKVNDAKSGLSLAKENLTIKETGTRKEDIQIARAQLNEIKNQIEIIKEKIRKSTIYAPGDSIITKIWFEKNEIFRPGSTAISLSTSGNKITADISELDISKIRDVNGNDVLITLDAFPNKKFKGKVVFINPKEIIKDGDKYYSIDVYMSPYTEKIRSGMSADLILNISLKKDIVKIPVFAIIQKDGESFVNISNGKTLKEVKIETGISDGEYIEVTSGLNGGEIISIITN